MYYNMRKVISHQINPIPSREGNESHVLQSPDAIHAIYMRPITVGNIQSSEPIYLHFLQRRKSISEHPSVSEDSGQVIRQIIL